MAEEESLQLEVNEPKKRPKWMMIAIIAGAGILLAAIVAGVVMFLSDDGEERAEQVEISTPLTQGDALYVGMPRPFLFNLPGEKRSYLVQIKVQIQVRGYADQEIAKKHIPLIEDSLLSTFSSADAKQLSTREGKEELRTQALINVQTTLQGITGRPVVERVLFTGFVMQ